MDKIIDKNSQLINRTATITDFDPINGFPYYSYCNPVNDKLPIVAYQDVKMGNPEVSEIIDKGFYEAMRDCGFNMAMLLTSTTDKFSMALRILDNLGMKAIVNCSHHLATVREVKDPLTGKLHNESGDTANLKRFINDFKGFNSLWGWLLTDEPSYSILMNSLQSLTKGSLDIRTSYKEVRTISPEKVAFFNLAVGTSESIIGPSSSNLNNGKKYLEYLRKICKIYNPQLITVDIYPVRQGSTNVYIRKDYYQYMEALGQMAMETCVPYWIYLLCNKHTTFYCDENTAGKYGNGAIYPMPTEGTIRFQVFSALALGAQGLVYWTYGRPDNKYFSLDRIKECSGKPSEEYYAAPILNSDNAPYWEKYTNEFGEASIYNAIKKVNQEIDKFASIFLNAKFISSVHAYGSDYDSEKYYTGTKTMKGPFQCVERITLTDKASGVLLSYLKGRDNDYLVVVSHDPVNPQDLTIYWNGNYKVYHPFAIDLSPETPDNPIFPSNPGDKGKISLNLGTQSITLDPGGFQIYRFVKI